MHFGKPEEIRHVLANGLLAVPRSAGDTIFQAWASMGAELDFAKAADFLPKSGAEGVGGGGGEDEDDELDADGVTRFDAEGRYSPMLNAATFCTLFVAGCFIANVFEAIVNAMYIKDNTDGSRRVMLAIRRALGEENPGLKRQDVARSLAEFVPAYGDVELSCEPGPFHVGIVWRKRGRELTEVVRTCGDHRVSLSEAELKAVVESSQLCGTLETFAGPCAGGAEKRRYSLALHQTMTNLKNGNTQHQRNKEWLGEPAAIVVVERVAPEVYGRAVYAQALEGVKAFAEVLAADEGKVRRVIEKSLRYRKVDAWPGQAAR